MKRIIFLMIALLLMSGMVMAQGQRRGEQVDPKVRAERMTERMVKEYSLNDKQKKELLEVNMALVEKMSTRQYGMKQGQKADGNKEKSDKKDRKKDGKRVEKKDRDNSPKLTQEERQKIQQEMKASREAYDTQLKKILTKEQFDSYTKKQVERQQKMKDGHQGRRQKPAPEK